MKSNLLIGLIMLGSLGAAHAQSLPELQSRCGNDAAAFFTRFKLDQADPAKNDALDPSKDVYDYENQYSESMKGCFIVIEQMSSWKWSSYSYRETQYRLFDVNAHRNLGYFSKTKTSDPTYQAVVMCDFDGVDCSGEAEWRAKVQPYVPGWRG